MLLGLGPGLRLAFCTFALADDTRLVLLGLKLVDGK
jgi:hypothetical protein